jgi:hypothetical protein
MEVADEEFEKGTKKARGERRIRSTNMKFFI